MKFNKIYKIGNFTFEVDWSKEIEKKDMQKLFKKVKATGFKFVGFLACLQYFLVG
ncbi:hypothetical protein [Vibrio cyclitrophicus]|uniref:hypothetical protein n=1 Tax=Vibrio cyclitrophicus TaxID=47951 RepID=UPI00148BA72C|nr:hypothetical protein [Vibrio cyclitrophicus]